MTPKIFKTRVLNLARRRFMPAVDAALARDSRTGKFIPEPMRDLVRAGFDVLRPAVPRFQTSLARSPGENPGPPKQPVSMVWLHHSTGDRLLRGGLRSALKAQNIDLREMNYGQGAVGDYVIGDHTDPGDFCIIFNTSEYFEKLVRWQCTGGDAHSIVMFKSCFPAANIESDEMLKQYREHFESFVAAMVARPEILFIPLTVPPLVRAHTTPENAARARSFADWLSREFAADIDNIQVFDLFDALAIDSAYEDANTLVPQFSTHAEDSHPNSSGAEAVTRLFVPWLNRTLRARAK